MFTHLVLDNFDVVFVGSRHVLIGGIGLVVTFLLLTHAQNMYIYTYMHIYVYIQIRVHTPGV